VRAAGQSWTSSLLVVRALANQREVTRFGIVATKRLGKAVRRNRVRRVIREAMRRLCPRLQSGWDLVIIARSPALQASLGQVEADLVKTLGRAQLLMRPPEESPSSTGGLTFET
jgi:ribonuclease P protein component